ALAKAGFPTIENLFRRLFSSPLPCPHEHLPFRERGALCCPDFPFPSAVALAKANPTKPGKQER
ncbi:MAG TPA: hypothetical protein PLB87_06740, partial [Prolixibacteraceae bacterium]|nr:hypothetical protein [Prolixibacteraceae bacterium]